MLGSIGKDPMMAQASGAGDGGGAVLGAFIIISLLAASLVLLVRWRRRARQAGYPGLHAYLRSAPRTDAEKRAAIDMALRGLVICVLGALVPPLLILGLFPLYYGGRKLCMAWMGLEILDEPNNAASESSGEPASPDATA